MKDAAGEVTVLLGELKRGRTDALYRLLPRLGVSLECCVSLRVDEEELVKRLLKRAEIEGRPDDNERTIRTRMQVYKESTAPLIAYYRARGVLREVDGEGSVSEVAKLLEQALATGGVEK